MNKEPGDSKLDYLPEEFGDVLDIIEMGAQKHGMDSYLQPGVFTFNKRLQSMFRHQMKISGLWYSDSPRVTGAIENILELLEDVEYDASNLLDDESGKSHFLHSMCNAGFFHELISRGILK